ncbi:Rha family transcriptional regulator [Burkholderia sp. Nafp2/4-1b]|uniref:Rha family transcriptional regulator n=1 Tax=Burkholderia sp. Nafp2/4-1b TaxID=2116686 RepID=UPI000EF8CDF9|nr:Rha family transcriptional regulator [Burkholderia sp. Nafp2/4-1b]RKU03372.1 Rha family transcriptional regulator [Burkholderia sp. Nafp2/4-1b]
MSAMLQEVMLTMSSREIAALVEKRHDNVKRTIESLANQGVIACPQIEGVQETGGNHRTYITQQYVFAGELGKRDSIVVVAQLSPEFTARLVDRWRVLEQRIVQPTVTSAKIAAELAIVESYTRLLSPSPSCRIAMLTRIAESNGVSAAFLPAYAVDAAADVVGDSSMPTKPLTDLLRDHGIAMRPHVYNGLLAEAGFLVERKRKSSSSRAVDGMKSFWVVTEEGQRYGKNITHPGNPRETQPHWYVARFAELHSVVSACLVGAVE